MNVEGLTNRQLMVRALSRMVMETEMDGRPSLEAMDFARAALGEVVRNKKPESLPKLKSSKRV